MDSFEVVRNSDEFLDGLAAALGSLCLFCERSETPSELTSSSHDKVGCNGSISYYKLFTLKFKVSPKF
jgi:hypothetical protein